MKKSPLTAVKERFGEDRKQAKAKLIEAVKELAKGDLWVERVSEDKGLERVSNRKLLHLETVLAAIKNEHGSRKGLVDAILAIDNRSKDEGYRSRLEGQPTPRLWDHYRSAKKRSAA